MLRLRSYQKMRRFHAAALRESGATHEDNRFIDDLREAIISGHYKPHEFSIRTLWEIFVPDGREMMLSWDPRTRVNEGMRVSESGVDTGAFANVFGQITYASILPQFNNPAFIGEKISRNVPTPFEFERIPGVSNLGDVTQEIGEGKPYPTAGLSEEFVDTRPTKKHGVLVPITKEAAFFDRTGQILHQAQKVAQAFAIDKEKRILDVALGIVTCYRYNGRAAVATYGDNSGDHDWDNLATSNPLVNYTDIENIQLLFDAITDPSTGEPVMIDLTNMQLIVPSALRKTAHNVINSTEVRFGDITSGTGLQHVGATNPLSGDNLQIESNQYVKDRTSSDSTYFLGNFQDAVEYRENWPASTPPVPPNSHDEIHKDIMHQFKVTERGEAQMVNPRVIAKSTAA